MRGAIVAAMVFASVVPASAQRATPGRPLFGGEPTADPRRPAIDLTVSLASGHDDDLNATQEIGGGIRPEAATGGQYSVLDASMRMRRQSPRTSVGAQLATITRYYPAVADAVGSSESATVYAAVKISRRTSLQASADGQNASRFGFDTLAVAGPAGANAPAAANPIGTAAGVNAPPTVAERSYGASVAIDHLVGRRGAFGILSGVRHLERNVTGERFDDRLAGALAERTLGSRLVLRGVYTLRQGTVRLGDREQQTWGQDATLGLQREWRHSPLRRTVVSASAGPSLTTRDHVDQAVAAVPNDTSGAPPAVNPLPPRELRAAGTLTFLHDFSRVWTVEGSYRRGTGLLRATAFSEMAAVGIRGAVGRRVTIALAAGYDDNASGVADLQSDASTRYGSARLQLALSRFVAAYGQYLAYHYGFGGAAFRDAARDDRFDRRGFQCGVTTWMPIRTR